MKVPVCPSIATPTEPAPAYWSRCRRKPHSSSSRCWRSLPALVHSRISGCGSPRVSGATGRPRSVGRSPTRRPGWPSSWRPPPPWAACTSPRSPTSCRAGCAGSSVSRCTRCRSCCSSVRSAVTRACAGTSGRSRWWAPVSPRITPSSSGSPSSTPERVSCSDRRVPTSGSASSGSSRSRPWP